MSLRLRLKLALKRGALVTAANWPLTLIQSVANSLFKLLIAAPLVGGIFLVALVVGTDPEALLSLTWRRMAATIVTSLVSHPAVLAAFLSSMAVVLTGGGLLMFLIKGGTVSILLRAERGAGPIEVPPLRLDLMAQAWRFSLDLFIESARALFSRYAQLGALLVVIYVASAAAYLGVVSTSRATRESWMLAGLVTVLFVAWITVVNLLYALAQIVIAADQCGVSTALRRVLRFVRHQWREVGGVCLVILVMVALANGTSVLAAAGLGLISFVPFVGQFIGLAVLPLQLLAWLFRDVVFQYIDLSSMGAYMKLYRTYVTQVPDASSTESWTAGGRP